MPGILLYPASPSTEDLVAGDEVHNNGNGGSGSNSHNSNNSNMAALPPSAMQANDRDYEDHDNHDELVGGPVLPLPSGEMVVVVDGPAPEPPLAELINRLLHPPATAFHFGLLTFPWAFRVLGIGHFNFRTSDERWVLKQSSLVREQGIRLGMPQAYLDWLCGDNEEISAAEQNVVLTPGFFRDIQEGRGG